MPSLTNAEAFGSSASLTGKTLTINFNDSVFSTLSASSPTASQLVAALLNHWSGQSSWATDKDKGIAPGSTNTKQQITTRGGVSVTQIARPITINIYENDNQATFDPDNAI